MKTRILLIIILMLLTCSVSAQESRASVALTAAIYEEEVTGNLDRAVELYLDILKKYPDDRPVAAKTLYHLGLVNEKMGKQKATEYFTRLVNTYPDQKEMVALAKERLSNLLASVESPAKPIFREIKIPTQLPWSVKLSPDGKNIALVSDKKLWIMPLEGNLGPGTSGVPVQVNTENIKVEEYGLSWSADGKWIAFNEFPKSDSSTNQNIFMVPSSGGKPKKIFENYRSAQVINYQISLSPNAKEIVFTCVEDNKQHIYKMNTEGGNPEKLVEMEAREPVFSPDGKKVAFVEDKGMGRGGGNLWMIDSNNNNPVLVAKAGNTSSPAWSPDGSKISYIDADTNKQIKIVQIPKEGKDPAKIISIDIPEGKQGSRLLAGWTPEDQIGALFVPKDEYALYTLPAEGGQAAMVLRNNIMVTQPRWVPNDNKICYVTPQREGPDQAYRYTLATVPADGGKGHLLAEIKDENFVRILPFQAGVKYSPDGKEIVAVGWMPGDKIINNAFPTTHIYKISSDGLKWEKLTDEKDTYVDFNPSWSPDGKKIAFLRCKVKKGEGLQYEETGIYIISSLGGEPERIYSESEQNIWLPVWSSDGDKIAFFTTGAGSNYNLCELNINNGEKQIITNIPGFFANMDPCWSPDCRRIALNAGKMIKIYNLNDGSIQDINTNLVDATIFSLDWSPDGKQFVFAGLKSGSPEFWLMENFLPE